MRVFRLDAIHDAGDGALTRFFQEQVTAELTANSLEAAGWLCDVYDDNVPAAMSGVLMLCGPWPTAPTDALVELAGGRRLIDGRTVVEVLG